MSINASWRHGRQRFSGDRRGFALILTLALVALISVVVVAFLFTVKNQQMSTAAQAGGIQAESLSQGAISAIVATLQQEMYAGSGVASGASIPPMTNIILSMTNPATIQPSRSVRSTVGQDGTSISTSITTNYPSGTFPNPNDPYFQYANLIKQSLGNTPPYSIANVTSPISIASSIPTTLPAADGRYHDGTYWRLPQLLVTPSSAPSATNDPVIPDWIYVTRSGGHPTNITGSPDQTLLSGSANPAYVTARYAYNIYDIGGLLNANVVANALTPGVSPQTIAPSAGTTPATQIVPGYKGSLLTADLNGLTLNGTLTNATTVPNWQALPNWRAQGNASTNWTTVPSSFQGFAYLLTGGEFDGWLHDYFRAFDPVTAALNTNTANAPLSAFRFTSRQDLINWVAANWSGATWVLPYLTDFSFDTDAPSYSPDPNRPKVAASAINGGNDAYGQDDTINPALTTTNNGVTPPVDTNGNPLIKRRFPLSCLALIANCNPANPPTANPNFNAAQIQYDFGLIWNPALTDPYTTNSSPGWVYVGHSGQTNNPTSISNLNAIQGRSPDFFETLRAAIAVGSLGQQYGSYFDNGPTYGYGVLGGRDSYTQNHIFQIGANIISQASTNYSSCHIQGANTNNLVQDFYGDQDFPGFYKDSVHEYELDQNTSGTNMLIAHDANSPWLNGTYSQFHAWGVEPELWNIHAPNAIASSAGPSTSYPTKFRIVPLALTPTTIYSVWGGNAWATGANLPTFVGSGDYLPAGGVNCGFIRYEDTSKYIQLTPEVPSISPQTLSSFREPCPIIGPNLPPNTQFFNGNTGPGRTLTTMSSWDGQSGAVTLDLSNVGNIGGTPSIYPSSFNVTAAATNPVASVVLGYFYSGPFDGDPWNFLVFSLLNGNGHNTGMTLLLQYQPPNSGNWYTYDVIDSAYSTSTVNAGNNPLFILMQQKQTLYRFDPRTGRWGTMFLGCNIVIPDYYNYDLPVNGLYPAIVPGQTLSPGKQALNLEIMPNAAPNFTCLWNHPTSPFWANLANGISVGMLQLNQPSGSFPTQQMGSGIAASLNATYYQDPDGVVRLADGGYCNNLSPGSGTYGLPMMMLTNQLAGEGPSLQGPANDYSSRPVILGRPFQSVGELGYVFRDVPFKSLDFFSPQSGDAALLDYFCAYGPDPWSYASATYNTTNTTNTFLQTTGLVAGRVNLNSAPPGVLAALLEGSSVTIPTQAPSALTVITAPVATAIGLALNKWTHTDPSANALMGPLRNRAELVGKFVSGSTGSTAIYSGFSFGDPNTPGNQLENLLFDSANWSSQVISQVRAIKQQRESVVRALADVGTTRTWNLLIDLVVQSGHLVPKAQTLDKFAVTGERHVWVSVAIDRMTGKVFQIRREPVRL